jgi:hypothetical protein
MLSSVFKTKKLVFVRKGTLFMTAETEAIKAQILSTGNAEILLEENDFLIVKWIKPEIKYSMAAYQYGKTGMANNYPCAGCDCDIYVYKNICTGAMQIVAAVCIYFCSTGRIFTDVPYCGSIRLAG